MVKRFATGPNTRDWLLDKFAKGTINYWFAFIADFASALFFLGWEFTSKSERVPMVGAAFAVGIALWGLTEYVFHRWVYHQEAGIFGEGHRLHHSDASTLIAMPWFMTTVTVFGLWHFCARSLGIPYFSSVLSGWLVGFVAYSLVHHSHHHWNMRNGWIRRLKAYHRVHHQFPDCNYGVTMRIWDRVFGTFYRKPVSPNAAYSPGIAGQDPGHETYPDGQDRPDRAALPARDAKPPFPRAYADKVR